MNPFSAVAVLFTLLVVGCESGAGDAAPRPNPLVQDAAMETASEGRDARVDAFAEETGTDSAPTARDAATADAGQNPTEPMGCAAHPLFVELRCPESIECACGACGDSLEQCLADTGCSEMIACAVDRGCSTAPDCYQTCRVLIHGSAVLALYDAFVSCFANETCKAECPCPLDACPTTSFYPVTDLPPCCPANATPGVCGLDLRVAQSFYGGDNGLLTCWEHFERPADPLCPSSEPICFSVGIGGGAGMVCGAMAGCCLDDGQCGYMVSLTGENAPCVPRAAFGDASVACR